MSKLGLSFLRAVMVDDLSIKPSAVLENPLLAKWLLSREEKYLRRERSRQRNNRRKRLSRGKFLGLLKESGDWERFHHHRRRLLVSSRRKCARKDGIKFMVSAASLHWPEHCPILGLKIDYTTLGRFFPNSPSIDRVDPRIGYIPGNVSVISHRANSLKSRLTIEEMDRMCAYVRSHSPSVQFTKL